MILDTMMLVATLCLAGHSAIHEWTAPAQGESNELVAHQEKPNLYDYTLERRMETWRRDKQRFLRYGPGARPLPPPPTPDYYYHDCPWRH